MRIFFVVIIAFFCFHIGKETQSELVFGISCGECVKDCFIAFKTEGGKAFRHISMNIPSNNKFQWNMLPDSLYSKIKAVEDAIPGDLQKYADKIGCPDCHDQCGYYIFCDNGFYKKTLFIDPDAGKHPPEFDAFFKLFAQLNLY